MMLNSSTREITFISNEKATQRTTLMYDLVNKRVIEKYIGYQLKSNSSQYVITDRIIYSYSRLNKINTIIEIKKGPDERMFPYLNDNNEYTDIIFRELRENRIGLIDINYFRINNFPKNRKLFPIISLKLEGVADNTESSENVLRVKYKIKKGRFFNFIYSQKNPRILLRINEYKIILDLSIINTFLNYTEIPMLMSIPPIIFKIKNSQTKENLPNRIEKISVDKQDYMSYYISGYRESILLHETVTAEELFVLEQQELDKMLKHHAI